MDNNNNNNNNNNSGVDKNADPGLNLGDGGTGSAPNPNAELTSDPTISKHLDIAIEAQDGKKDAIADTDTKGGDKEKGADKSVDSKAGDGSGGDKSTQQQPDKKGEEAKKAASPPKDLIDSEGKVIARGGAERRFYEQAQIAKQEAQHLRNQLAAAQEEARKAREQVQTIENTVRTTNGMAPKDMAIAANIFTDLQRDPVGTVRKLLAELVANGHTIEGIGQGVDAAAIERIVAERVAHLTPKPTDDEQARVADVEKEVAQFYSNFPDARPHDAVLAKMVRDNPDIPLDVAYFQLKGAFAERGFDWSLSLEDNIKAQSGQDSTASGADNNNSNNNNGQQPARPMPNGRAPDGQIVETKQTVVAHENTDMGDIIRMAMREQNLNI